MLTEAILCLALNIYYEANAEPMEGKIAVANVTMNRTKDSNYPNKVCSVVYQNSQFSWTLTKKEPPKGKGWEYAKSIAILTLTTNSIPDITNGATHFHNNTVKPKWAKDYKKVIKIGNHTFYKKNSKAS